MSKEAAKLAAEVFPGKVEEPAGGPPKLPTRGGLTGFPTVDAAQIDLGGGEHGVIDSTVPIAVEASPGQRTSGRFELA